MSKQLRWSAFMEKDYIYTAGLIDGEGTIGLSRVKKNQFYSPYVSVTNTSYEIIDYLKSNYGGVIINQKTYKQHHKKAWIWRISYDNAINFISKVTPYMKEQEKIRRSKLILDEYKNVTKRNGKYTDSQKQAKLDFENRFFHPSTP